MEPHIDVIGYDPDADDLVVDSGSVPCLDCPDPGLCGAEGECPEVDRG